MSDETKLARAEQAGRILRDPLFTEAFDSVRAALLNKIEMSPVRDEEGREKAFLMLKALRDARAYLEQAMNDGKVVIELKERRRLFGIGK